MALIQWAQKYVVGIPEIDEQHQSLIQLTNTLYDMMRRHEANEKVTVVLDELFKYAATHFSTEEKLMRARQYPDSINHIREHKNFTARVQTWLTDFKAGRTTLSVEILTFLNGWIGGHILDCDRKYVPFLKPKSDQATTTGR